MPNLLSKLSPRGRWKKWTASVFLLIIAWFVSGILIDLVVPEYVLVTISKETTYITEPLKANGYPDYLTYLHRQLSEGVAPENNAYITILQMTGPPRIEDPASKQEYYKWLGIEPLPSNGEYLQSYYDYGFSLREEYEKKHPYTEEESRILGMAMPAAAAEAPEDQSPEAIAYRKVMESPAYKEREKFHHRITNEEFMAKPWTAKDYPEAAEWLAKQEPILAKLDELKKRPRFFAPFQHAKASKSLSDAYIPHANLVRQVADVVIARGNLAIGSGDRGKALQDIRLLFQLSDYMHGSTTMYEQDMANILQRTAEAQLNHLIHQPNTTIEELNAIESDYKQLRQMDLVKTLDRFDRLHYLSMVCSAAEAGTGESEVFASGSYMTGTNNDLHKSSFFTRKQFNYDWMLRDGNDDFDQLIQIIKITDRNAQKNAVLQFDKKSEGVSMKKSDCLSKVVAFFSTKQSRSKKLAGKLKIWGSPSAQNMIRVKDDDDMARELQIVSFALARYRIKNGKYPIDFAELKSEGISAIPTDIFKQSACVYSSDGTGFLLYSVGKDGKDAEGFAGEVSSDRYDDIAVYSPNHVPKAPVPPVPEEDSAPMPSGTAPITNDPMPMPAGK